MIQKWDIGLESEGYPSRTCLSPEIRSSFTPRLVITSATNAVAGTYSFQMGGITAQYRVDVTIGALGAISSVVIGSSIYGGAPSLSYSSTYQRIYTWSRRQYRSWISVYDVISNLPSGLDRGGCLSNGCGGTCSDPAWQNAIPLQGSTYQLTPPLLLPVNSYSTGCAVIRDPGTLSVAGNPTNTPTAYCSPAGPNDPVGSTYVTVSYIFCPPNAEGKPIVPPEDQPTIPVNVYNPGPGGSTVCYSVNGGAPVCVYINPGTTTVDVPVDNPGDTVDLTTTDDDGNVTEYPPIVYDPYDPNDPTNDGTPIFIYIPPPIPNPDPEPEPEPEPDGDSAEDGNFQGCIQRACPLPYLYKFKSKPTP